MRTLGVDITMIEIDEHNLCLNNVLGPRIDRCGNGARHHKESHASRGRPIRLLR